MCESGSEWEKSPRGKIIQIFFFYYFRFLFLLGRKTSQKKSLFYWYQKVFDLQCVETLPLRFEVLWLILESLWETELVRQLRLIDDCAQLLSSTAWFSWDSRNFKVQHPKWEWKAPREELPAWRGVVGLFSEISFLNQNKSRIKPTSSNLGGYVSTHWATQSQTSTDGSLEVLTLIFFSLGQQKDLRKHSNFLILQISFAS